MSCCKKIRQAGRIAKGFTRLAIGRKCPATDDRLRICRQCDRKDQQKWERRSLWCTLCGCYIPAKARVEEEACPLGKWPDPPANKPDSNPH